MFYRIQAGPLGRPGGRRALCAELKQRNVGLHRCRSSLPKPAAPRARHLRLRRPAPEPTRSARSSRERDPLGFILFARNCETPDQVRALVARVARRRSAARRAGPDRPGGRPRRAPAAAALARRAAGRALRRRCAAAIASGACEAARLNARLIAAELRDLGIDVDCAPVLDLPLPGAARHHRRPRLATRPRRAWRALGARRLRRACSTAACCR